MEVEKRQSAFLTKFASDVDDLPDNASVPAKDVKTAVQYFTTGQVAISAQLACLQTVCADAYANIPKFRVFYDENKKQVERRQRLGWAVFTNSRLSEDQKREAKILGLMEVVKNAPYDPEVLWPMAVDICPDVTLTKRFNNEQ